MSSQLADPFQYADYEKTIVLHSAKDAMRERPPMEWCVDGLLPSKSLSILVGAPGSKKTLTAMDLAVCVAMGKPWLGRPARQGVVMWLDEQNSFESLCMRMNAAITAHGAGPDLPLHFTWMAGFSLRDDNAAGPLYDLFESWQPRLVVIDAFTNLLQGGSESRLGLVLPTLIHLRGLAEFGNSAILVTHHTNRHGFFQGCAAISASVDLMLAIEAGYDTEIVQLRPLKSRFQMPQPITARAHFDRTEGDLPSFHLSLEDNQGSSAAGSMPPPAAGLAGLPLTLYFDFCEVEHMTFDQVRARHPDYADGSVRNAIQKLLMEGVIVRTDDGGIGTEALYARKALPGSYTVQKSAI